MKHFGNITGFGIWHIFWFSAGQCISHGAFWLLSHIFNLLHKYFPDTFKLPSPITNAPAYDRWYLTMMTIAFAVGMLISVYLSVCLDNGKYEYIIAKTEGFYYIKDGMRLYMKKYCLADIIGTAVATVALLLPTLLLPTGFFTKDYSFLLSFLYLFKSSHGVAPCALTVYIISLICHIPASALALRKWRALWLSGFAR